jgi:hypothetical protein
VPPGIRPPHRSPHLSGLKETVRRLLDLDDDMTVVIRQLACTEPGCRRSRPFCPWTPRPVDWTLPRPVAQLTSDDLRALLATHLKVPDLP